MRWDEIKDSDYSEMGEGSHFCVEVEVMKERKSGDETQSIDWVAESRHFQI